MPTTRSTPTPAAAVKLPKRYRDFLARDRRKYQGWYLAELPRYKSDVRFAMAFVEPDPALLAQRGIRRRRGLLPLSTLGDEPQLLVVDVSKKQCPVAMWEHEDGKLHPVANSLDELLARLHKSRTANTPAEASAAALVAATKLFRRKQYRAARDALEALAPAPANRGDKMHRLEAAAREQARLNLLGLCHEALGQLTPALSCFRAASRAGSGEAGLNLARIAIAAGKDLAPTYAMLRKMPCSSDERRFHVLDYQGQIDVLRGDAKGAHRNYKLVLHNFEQSDVDKVKQSRAHLTALLSRQKRPGLGEEILTWLRVPEAALSADDKDRNRAWWDSLPGFAAFWQGDLLEMINKPARHRPSDQELARILAIKFLWIRDDTHLVYDLTPILAFTALEQLSIRGEFETLEPLRALRHLKKVSINYQDCPDLKQARPGRSPAERELFAACECGDVHAARRALDAGAKLSARNEHNLTPLHVAVSYVEDPDVALLLIARGADLRAKGGHGNKTTPLDCCSGEKRERLMAAAQGRR